MTQHRVPPDGGARARLVRLGGEAEAELREHILPFWLSLRDEARGGFFGVATSRGRPLPSAPKGLVMHARILWTFSKAHARWPDPRLLDGAGAAFRFIAEHLIDREHGGVFWTATAEGAVADGRKHLYAQAFAILGLAAYHEVTGDAEARRLALALSDLVEARAADRAGQGYFEAFARDWSRTSNDLMSRPDAARTFNAHFHLLEAYDALLAVAPDPALARRVEALLDLLLEATFDRRRGTFRQFFDADWRALDDGGSNGHDIEASWLLRRVAARLGPAILTRTDAASELLAGAVLARAVDGDGGVFVGLDPYGVADRSKLWWVQAEALVGFLDAYRRSGETRFLDAAERVWVFIQGSVVDREHGEWRERVDLAATRRPGPKAHIWKGPYHNGRACLELADQALRLASDAEP